MSPTEEIATATNRSEIPAATEVPLTMGQIDAIASVCDAANEAYCMAHGLPPPLAGEEARESARLGVRAILEKRVRTAEDSHNGWMEHKLRAGWRWGPTKDPVEKTHPSLLPYHALPKTERRKDRLFVSICMALDPRR